MKRLLVVVAMFLLTPFSSVWAETVSRVAAVVNDDLITTHQLDMKVAERLRAEVGGQQLSTGEMDALRRSVLSELVEEALIRQRIDELGLKVADDEVEAAIQDVQKQNKLTREQLIQALQLEGMTFDAYRENLAKQILRFKLLGREVQSKVEVTNQEIRDYFRAHIDEFREPAYVRLARLSFLLPAKATAVQIEAVRSRADAALARLRKGEDFYSVLLASTADQSAEGGDLGTFKEGELTAAFEKAVQGLKEGEVSEVIETPDGFHILRVEERSPGKIRQFDAVQDEIQKAIADQKTEARFKEWAQDLRKNAYIDIRL
ncbi:MAG TPA: peptidyl-prolyl cis-trans isomerase [Desulfuromonadales bacterium]|nr:peptidyl-prolyl cis-trans isomerase [Desulfuromonadales bacterium]